MGKKNLEERRTIMEYRERLLIRFMTALVTSVILFLPLFAFAGGTTHEPLGAEDYLIGVAPPPGIAMKVYLQWYTANKLKDNSGNTLRDPVKLDKLNAFVDVNRILIITPLKFDVGGFTGFVNGHAVLVKPNLHLDVNTHSPVGVIDVDESHSGLGDVTFGPGIAWHHKSGLLHGITGVDIIAPTGKYDRHWSVNPGTNDWSVAPVLIFTVFAPFDPGLELSMIFTYTFNFKNNDVVATNGLRTWLTPGNEFSFSYDVMHHIWGPGHGMEFRGGIGGYFYQQTTDDKRGDTGTVKDNLGRVFAIGPALFFDYKMWIFSAHVYFETAARNRSEGIQSQLTVLCKF
jgi:hypothetical protein